MKIIKRDGRIVDYDREKIAIAIRKANAEVKKPEQANEKDIKNIIEYIEDLGKKRILVEDVQDIIEEKLMEIGKYRLAKKYIVYRYIRTLVRKQNTTDQSILGLIRNSNNVGENTVLASTQRDYIAGEVSKDLTKRMLLPEKIVRADEEGIIIFHNAEYFMQPIINSCIVNLEDMLDKGTIINGKLIETPKSFRVACIVTTQIIWAIANNQYGEQFIDIKALGKYLKNKEELKSGVQTILYQINTFMISNGKTPDITFFLNNDENDKYTKESIMIFEELERQKAEGIKNEEGIMVSQQYPKLVRLGEDDKEYKNKSNFNQGVVSINLTKVVTDAEYDEKKFWDLLDERLEICKEALMCRHYALLGTIADVSPVHWRYGAIARLQKGEKIDKLLYGGFSDLTLGYVGIDDVVDKMENVLEATILKVMKEKIKEWKKETNIKWQIEKKD